MRHSSFSGSSSVDFNSLHGLFFPLVRLRFLEVVFDASQIINYASGLAIFKSAHMYLTLLLP